jgi:hypothetical protein
MHLIDCSALYKPLRPQVQQLNIGSPRPSLLASSVPPQKLQYGSLTARAFGPDSSFLFLIPDDRPFVLESFAVLFCFVSEPLAFLRTLPLPLFIFDELASGWDPLTWWLVPCKNPFACSGMGSTDRRDTSWRSW